MRCATCRIFLMDSLPSLRFISPIEQAINRKRWAKYSQELAEYCLEFVSIFDKKKYDDVFQIICRHIMRDIPNTSLDEGRFVNILLNMDRFFQIEDPLYKSLKNHALTTIQERSYLPMNMSIEIEIIWLLSVHNFISVYDDIHTHNKSHLKN